MATQNRDMYMDDFENYSSMPFNVKGKPANGWAVSFHVGHKYKIHWGNVGLDWDSMSIEIGQRWEPSDDPIYFVHNFTDVRVEYDVTFNDEVVANDSIAIGAQDYKSGQNVLYNETEVREFHWVVTGKYLEEGKYTKNRILNFAAHRCKVNCFDEPPPGSPIEDEPRYWSIMEHWSQNRDEAMPLPAEGESFKVKDGWNMVFDLADPSDIFDKVEINGRLTFKQGMDLHFQAKKILIRGGELRIGTKEEPYVNNAKITLWGRKEEEAIAIEDQGVEAGSKIIANIGTLTMHGKKRSSKMTRLKAPARAGDTTITVDTTDVDLVEGDRIALAATGYEYDTGEDLLISAYDAGTGVVTLSESLKWYHWGAEESTAEQYNGVDIRGEVLILSRNIKIVGENIDHFGCQILTSDIMEVDGTFKEGKTTMDSVEIEFGGQKDT